MSTQSQSGPAAFGPNEWLVDEIRQQFLADRTSVDPAWWEFFEGTSPSPAPAAPEAAPAAPVAAPEAPVAAPVAAPAAPVAAPEAPVAAPVSAPASAETTILKGTAARVVDNMEASLTVPTATSVRSVPAKLMIDNRTVINNALARGRGGKVSFTHIIGYAMVRALGDVPAMNSSFAHVDGKPAVVTHPAIGVGIAVDLEKPDGTRQLLVP